MITGSVDSDLSPTISLPLIDSIGQVEDVVAVVDTGFNGYLTLPPKLIRSLGLKRRGRGRATLADGTTRLFEIYAAEVLWDGASRTIEAEAANLEPLIGMSLLKGYHYQMYVEDGGAVTIHS